MMAKVLILGGGFAGVVAAERLATLLGDEHHVTLVSRSRNFVFYPALVRLAFGKCEKNDVLFDLRHSMLSRRINFVEAEVAHVDPEQRKVTIAHGEVEGTLPYDYLIFALGRRLATEKISGFYEHAHHLLNVDKAIQFGKAVAQFQEGKVVLGECPGARLPVPVYESAFALADFLEAKGKRGATTITVVAPQTLESQLIDAGVAIALKKLLDDRQIELVTGFSIRSLTRNAVHSSTGDAIDFDLLMLVPPFRGSSAATYMGAANDEGYVDVNSNMRVVGLDRIYAAGDCVDFVGPKLGHMAIRQAEVAATNLAAEIQGREPAAHYSHEMRLVIDEIRGTGFYVHKDIAGNEPATVRRGQFWGWAKQIQQKYWEAKHS
jgi:NADH dehydrogenase FAD-containing subunit